jgi:hypothetical protein
MSNIAQGDSGNIIQAKISDDDGVVDISGCQAIFTIKTSKRRFEKDGVVVDPLNGLVEMTLDETDTSDVGNVIFQCQVIFPNTNKFSSSIGKFKIDPKL